MRIGIEPIRPRTGTTAKTRSPAADVRPPEDEPKDAVQPVAPPPGLGRFVDKSA